MNFGHGEAPLYACPIAKSAPVAENSTVFSVSAPIAFDAAAIVVPASCAAATDANRATVSAARIDLLVIVPSKQQLTRVDTTTHAQGEMYESRHAPLAARAVFRRRVVRHFGFAMMLIGGSLIVGILGYRLLEGMPFIDAYLNAAMLLGGMGPVKPDLEHPWAKVFAGLYAMYSGMVVIAAASIILAPLFHRFVHRFHLEDEQQRRGR